MNDRQRLAWQAETMASLLPLLVFVAVMLLMLVRNAGRSAQRDPRAFRPRRTTAGRRGHGDEFPFALRRADLTGLRDGYSGEALDPGRGLVRCAGCGVLYHVESARVLARENGGRCAACGTSDFRAVVLVDD